MIDIKTIAVPKNSSDGGATTIINNVSGSGSISGHNLWGQYFDGTQDLTGSITVQGNVTAEDGNFVYVNAPDGNIVRINGDLLTYNSGILGVLNVDNLNAKKATIDDLESIKGFISNFSAKNITTENLTVTKQAHFFELVIDKIKSVGGQMIMTAANCVADYVKAYNSSDIEVSLDSQNVAYYNVYFLANDPSGRSIENDWQENDQALCQSFNNVSTGVNYDVSNKYYWRLVKGILPACYMNLNTGAVNNNPNLVTKNSVTISNPRISYDVAGTTYTENTDWITAAQTSTELDTGVTWNQTSGGAGIQTVGTMETTNTIFGIKLVPIVGSDLALALPDTFSVNCSSPARLNIAINYDDDTYEYFKAPDTAQSSYTKTLNTETHIKSVIITNADEIEWHRVHGIKLSNLTGECDLVANADSSYNYSNIPSKGDNIVQLGYRYNRYTEGTPEYDIPRSSAIIIAAYHTPDTGITPPSYAQYTKITDFNLASHRGTYIDANGAKFVGNLYVDANTSVQDLINQSVTTQWYLHIAYADSSDGSVGFAIAGDTGQYAPIPGHSYQYMGFLSDTNATASTNYTDYEWVEIPGGSGTQGASVVYAYMNYTPTQAQPTPQKPPQGTVIDSTHSYQNWYYTATTPNFAAGEYTWMIQTYELNGVYGVWSDPIRITGDNGQPGEDGKYTEFIYQSFNTIQSWTDTGVNGINPHYWNNTSNVDSHGYSFNHEDYTGPVSAGWSDNPTGATENMKYEYVAQRIYDGQNFLLFSEPVLWSKYGENGRDGDGYEYIYYVNNDENTVPTINYTRTTDYNGRNILDDDFCPYVAATGNDHWYDDPQPVSSTNKYEWVATRKKVNGAWQTVGGVQGGFSTPTIWGSYSIGTPGPQGPTGPQGEQGEQGEDAIVYKLVDQGSVVQTVMSLNQSNSIVTNFVISLRFKVIKIEGGTSRFMTYEEMHDFPKVAGTSNGFYAYRKYNKNTNNGDNSYIRLTLTTVANAADESSTIVPTDDALFIFSDNKIYNSIYQAYKSVSVALIMYNSNSIAPTSTNLKYTVDTKEIPVTLASAATLSIVQGENASIKTLVTGQQGLAQQYSELSQTQDQISTRVTNIEEDYVTQSTLAQTANGIRSDVVEIYNNSDGIAKTRTVDLRNLSETSFYPVVVSLPPYYSQSASVTTRIIIERLIDINYGGPSYSTHHVGNNDEAPLDGFPLYFDMSTQSCGWGNIWGYDESKPYNGEPLYVQKYEVSYTKDTNNIPKEYIVGSMKQNYIGSRYETASETDDWLPSGNDEIIYLRGGSKYDIGSSWVGSAIALYSGGYQYSKTSGGTTHTYNAYVISDYRNFNVAQQDAMTRSEIVQTANNIQLNVYNDLREKTGIDITTGQITLNANNTDVIGNLNLRRTNNGLTVFDIYGTPRINIHPSSIGEKNEFASTKIQAALDSTSQRIWNNFDYTTSKNNNACRIGSFSVGYVVKLTDIFFNSFVGSYPQTWQGTINYEVKLYNAVGDNNVKTWSGSCNGGTKTQIPTSNQSYTIQTSGDYYIIIHYWGSIGSTNYFICQPTYYMTIDTRQLTDIGLDGVAIKQGTDKYAYFSSSLTEIRNINSGIRFNIDASSIHSPQQYVGTITGEDHVAREVWKTIGSVKNTYIKTDSYGWSWGIHPEYDTVICTNTGGTIQLPYYSSFIGTAAWTYTHGIESMNTVIPVPIGTILYIKGYGNTYVQSNRHIVMYNENYQNTAADHKTNIGNRFCGFIHAGNGVWCQMMF